MFTHEWRASATTPVRDAHISVAVALPGADLRMKAFTVCLLGSLVLNAMLGVAITRQMPARNSAGTAASASSAATEPASPSSTGIDTDATSSLAKSASGGGSAFAENWAELTSGELPDVVARLRAAGVSPRLVRKIVAALVSERFADQHRALLDAMAARPWWEGQQYEAYADPAVTAQRRKLNLATRDLVYRLLGPEEPVSDYDRDWRERRYGSMSSDKLEKFRTINLDYADLMAEVREQGRDIILPEDREKLAFLEEEKRKDIEKLLSPEEHFNFELRSSPTARRLREQLDSFDPTEEEFRAIFRIHAAIDAKFAGGRVANLSQAERRQRRDAVAAADAQIKDVLTPARYEAYQRANPAKK